MKEMSKLNYFFGLLAATVLLFICSPRVFALTEFVKNPPVTPYCSHPKWIQKLLASPVTVDELELQEFYRNFEFQLENSRKNEIVDEDILAVETADLRPPLRIDRILVEKSKNKLHLISGAKLFKTYQVSLGFSPLGNKTQEGDGKTPEGLYKVELKNPNSAYHLALKLSYPNERDELFAKRHRVAPGGFIMIHGFPKNDEERQKVELLHGKVNWTEGCMGMTDSEIEEVYPLVDYGTTVEICP